MTVTVNIKPESLRTAWPSVARGVLQQTQYTPDKSGEHVIYILQGASVWISVQKCIKENGCFSKGTGSLQQKWWRFFSSFIQMSSKLEMVPMVSCNTFIFITRLEAITLVCTVLSGGGGGKNGERSSGSSFKMGPSWSLFECQHCSHLFSEDRNSESFVRSVLWTKQLLWKNCVALTSGAHVDKICCNKGQCDCCTYFTLFHLLKRAYLWF